MSLQEFAKLGPAQSVRRIEFDSAEVVGGFPGGQVLVVRGEAPCLNIDVRLSPLVYVECPEYWEIEVIGSLPGNFCLTAIKPYAVSMPLAGVVGSSGIEVVGNSKRERIEVEGGCRRGQALG